MTAIHAHRIAPFLGEWQLHETFDVLHPAPILLREESQSVTTSRLVPSKFGQSGARLRKPSVDLRAAPMGYFSRFSSSETAQHYFQISLSAGRPQQPPRSHRPFDRRRALRLEKSSRASGGHPDQLDMQTALCLQKGGIPSAGLAGPVSRFACSQAGARLWQPLLLGWWRQWARV